MTRDDIMKFTLVTPVADVTRVMAKVRHRYFPILDEDGKYCGMVSRRNIIALRKRRIILVDHNEATQAVEGFDQAEILEIIDHHRIGSLETSGPVYFRNQPVGCTATIITQMYDENGVEIRPQIAGLLLAAILSDTLVFRSPTCTPVDVSTAHRLAKIAGARSTPLPPRCSRPARSWTARPRRKSSCRISRCSCAATSASAWRRAAT